MTQAAGSSPYDVVYGTELVYQPDCWKLCGDAHCCNYTRYKRYGRPDEQALTQIPMLAGEYAYMGEHGLLGQYASQELRVTVVPGRLADYRFELLTVPAADGCPCDHRRRPTMCRLYPLLPTFEVGQGLVGFDPNFGVFEEVEELTGAPRACPLGQISFAQLQLLMRGCGAIAGDGRCVFSLMAYRAMKQEFRRGLLDLMNAQHITAHHALSLLMARGNYIDQERLAEALDGLLERFRAAHAHGPDFRPA